MLFPFFEHSDGVKSRQEDFKALSLLLFLKGLDSFSKYCTKPSLKKYTDLLLNRKGLSAQRLFFEGIAKLRWILSRKRVLQFPPLDYFCIGWLHA